MANSTSHNPGKSRHNRYLQIVFIISSLLAGMEGNAQSLYKSIRPDGKIIYSKHPPVDARVEKKLEFKDLPTSKVRAEAAKPGQTVSLPDGDVVLYAAAWCGYCRKAKAYLDAKGISYKEIDVDSEYGKNAFAQVGNGQGIPLLFAHGQRVQGYSESAYDAVFN